MEAAMEMMVIFGFFFLGILFFGVMGYMEIKRKTYQKKKEKLREHVFGCFGR